MSTVPPSAGGPIPSGPSQDPRSGNQNPGAPAQGAPGASPLPYSDQPTSVLPPASAPYQGAPQGDGAPGSPYQGGYPSQSGPDAQQNGYGPTAQQGGYGAPDYSQGAPYGQPGQGYGPPRWLPCAQEEHDGDHHRCDRRRTGRRGCGIRRLLVRIPRFLRSVGRIRADRVRSGQPRRSQCRWRRSERWGRFAQRRADLVERRREPERGLRLPGAAGQYDRGSFRCEDLGRCC